ncbi:MAG: hypothetical protein HDR27_00965 [Lachnospiraceae bacterium]|nr:hypothetical protein [Lachnospiraceae bacterium]
MKDRKSENRLKIAAAMMKMMLFFPAFMGWCGFLYPELTLSEGTCKAYTAEGEEREGLSGKEFYEELLQAEPKQVRVKSRLLEFLFSIRG